MNRILKAAMLFALSTATLCASPLFTITDLGPIGPLGSVADVNDLGQVVGTYRSPPVVLPDGFIFNHRGFLYSGGSMIDLGPGGANAINNSGQVVGFIDPGGSEAVPTRYHPFLYSGGSMTDLGFGGVAYGINDLGQIVGQTSVAHAFLYSGGSITDLGQMGGNGAAAADINNAGQIVGQGPNLEAYLYSGGTFIDVGYGPLPRFGSEEAVALAINSSGQAVGVTWTGSEYIAFLYSNGLTINLATSPGFKHCAAHDINDSTQIVGNCLMGGIFLYSNGAMFDLSNLVVNLGGWSLSYANAINNLGQIVGSGGFMGENRAYLLTPTSPDFLASAPEPSTFALAGAGLAAAIFFSRRRATQR